LEASIAGQELTFAQSRRKPVKRRKPDIHIATPEGVSPSLCGVLEYFYTGQRYGNPELWQERDTSLYHGSRERCSTLLRTTKSHTCTPIQLHHKRHFITQHGDMKEHPRIFSSISLSIGLFRMQTVFDRVLDDLIYRVFQDIFAPEIAE